MARCFRCALAALTLLVGGEVAAAQALGQAAAAARKAPPVDATVKADIEKLMVVTGQAELGIQVATTISDAFLNGFKETQKDVPPRAIEIIREVVNSEFAKGFNGPEFKDRQIALYAKYFTHAEIKGLIAFYESELGRKTIANMPHLMREGAEIGQQWAQGAMPKMMQVLETRLRAEGLIP
jgi:uncharacterized protein